MATKRFFWSVLLFMSMCVPQLTMADTDVSELLLTNWGFDSEYDYDKNATGNVVQEILDVPGWTKAHSMDYTIVGTYQFGTKKTFNTYGKVPAAGYDGSTGGLALSTGWTSSLIYNQTVTLPAGSYYLSAAWYNDSDHTTGKSQVGWVPNSGTKVMSTIEKFQWGGQWTIDNVPFELTEETTGKVQIGFTAIDGGSSASAKLVLDYIKIYMKDDAKALNLVHTYLGNAINNARSVAGTGSGVGLSDFNNKISQAQNTYNSNNSFTNQLNSYKTLISAIEKYKYDNASSSNPLDLTEEYIINGSFENLLGTDWITNGMKRQTNSVFSVKNGTYFVEAWVDRGNALGNVSIEQIIKKLPKGKYRIKAAATHIQQTGSGSNQNSGNPQTGGYLYAGNFKTTVTNMSTYQVDFVVNGETEDIPIGIYTENGTGNWIAADNFKLFFIGYLDVAAVKSYLNAELSAAEKYLSIPMQTSVKNQLNSAISAARNALNNTNATIENLQNYINTLKTAVEAAEKSKMQYEKLNARINYAKKVVNWWKNVEYRQTYYPALQSAITTAEGQYTNYSLTDTQLNNAVNTLNEAIKKVDKGIYESGSAVGSGSALDNPNSTWCNERSIQSKHWILYWEKGYGAAVPSGAEKILEECDKFFELYADELGFITINQGKSKTDQYKMIIRLKYKDEWEANGSGIDNKIGMLTLSRWAYSSRGGQTAAHEVGHCFQYQVHCDKGDWNGWMYNWTNSPGGNCFWEQCAQWMAYCYFTGQKFNNEWLTNSLNHLHEHPFSVAWRYENYFIQDYLVEKQKDIKFIGRLWNECINPEDPFQTYMRITMSGTSEEKLRQLGDEMWEFGARMTTFDFAHLNNAGSGKINARNQMKMTQDSEQYWTIDPDNCPENFGNNAIKLVAPTEKKMVFADFEGLNGEEMEGYRSYKPEKGGWRVGFVAQKNDGSTVYGDMYRATITDNILSVAFECPDNCKRLWLVVSGAPTEYWCRGWGDKLEHEQWPYKVRFYNTNLYGQEVTLTIDENLDELKDELMQLANNFKVPSTNIGNQPFQYPADKINAINNTIQAAKDLCNNPKANATQLNQAIEKMNSLEIPALNAPNAEARYTITNVSIGFNSKNRAITFVNDRNDQGRHTLRYLQPVDANYAQAFLFTPVDGKKDTYILSQTDQDGETRYICTGSVYGGNNLQIRTTKDNTKAAQFRVTPMTEEGNWYLWNIAADNYLSANNNNSDNGVYTSNQYYRMVIAEAEKATANLKIVPGVQYGTFIAPFKTNVPDNVTVYSVDNISNNVLQFTTHTTIEANTPYIVYSNTNTTIDENIENWGTAIKDIYDTDFLVGTLKQVSLMLTTNDYMLQKQGNNVAFFQCDGIKEYSVGANRAYLHIPTDEVKGSRYSFEPEATAIETIEAITSGNAEIYDINGRKLDKLQKGINIVNGKVVFVK